MIKFVGKTHAGVAELVDALDSKSSARQGRAGSIPAAGIMLSEKHKLYFNRACAFLRLINECVEQKWCEKDGKYVSG